MADGRKCDAVIRSARDVRQTERAAAVGLNCITAICEDQSAGTGADIYVFDAAGNLAVAVGRKCADAAEETGGTTAGLSSAHGESVLSHQAGV